MCRSHAVLCQKLQRRQVGVLRMVHKSFGNAKMKLGKAGSSLLLRYFNNFYFVVAAAVFVLNRHAAIATIFVIGITQLHTREIAHAVMQVYHETRTDGEINKEQYGYPGFFH